MEDVQQRLLACFQAVFPERDDKALMELSQETYSGWDSLASVTLVRLIEEQFGIQIDLFDLEELNSFSAMSNYLQKTLI